MRRALSALLLLASLGCSVVRDELTDVMQLSGALQAQFKLPLAVNIANGSYLTVSVQADTSQTRSDSARQALAFDVARFAYAHYKHPEALHQVSVRFISGKKYGPVNFEQTTVAGSWSPSELSRAP